MNDQKSPPTVIWGLMIIASLFFTFVFLLVIPESVKGQTARVAKNKLGVDIVTLSTAEKLRGIVMAERPNGDLWMLVERQWLSNVLPDLFREFEQIEKKVAIDVGIEFDRRIDKWLSERVDERMLLSFLEDEKVRIEKAVKENTSKPSSLFISVELIANRIRSVTRQPNARKRLAGLAWEHDIPDVSTSTVAVLKRKLEAIKVETQTAQFDLSAELPSISQSDVQWAAKKALVEYVLRDRIEFQGTGSVLVRAGKKPNEADLIGQLLANQSSGSLADLGAQLGLPEFKNASPKDDKWWLKATQEAEREGFSGVLITRVKSSPVSSIVEVESDFFAFLKPGSWFKVSAHSARFNINDLDQDATERLRQDPQVQSIMKTMQGLGLPVDASRIELAMKHGAATQKAIAQSKSAFADFQSTYAARLDSPIVPVK